MNPKSKKTLYEVVVLGVILVIILGVLIFRPGSTTVPPVSNEVPSINTEFDTSSLDQINQRQNTRSVLTPLDVGKSNPFRF